MHSHKRLLDFTVVVVAAAAATAVAVLLLFIAMSSPSSPAGCSCSSPVSSAVSSRRSLTSFISHHTNLLSSTRDRQSFIQWRGKELLISK